MVKNVTIKEVYLNIKNPIVFNEDLGSWDADFMLTRELYERGILTQSEAETVLLTDSKLYKRTTEAANKKLAEVLLAKGYDGIQYTNTHESKKDSTSYIIFDSNQAKLTTNTNPTTSKDIRHKARIAEAKYNKATANTEILNLVSNVSNGSFEQQDKVYFGTVSNDIAEQIKNITGIDVAGYRMAVEARQISYILKDHGKMGITDNSMADDNDIAKMKYTMRNPDEISYGEKNKAYSTMRNGKNRTADTVLYEKVIGEKSYYVV